MQQELQGIYAFVKIAEVNSFTRAAELLNTTQPSLTRRIKKLEVRLGAQLFERSTRKVVLTAVGRKFLPDARNLLDQFNNSILNIKEMASQQSGMLTIACLPTAAFYFLPVVIRHYNQQYPNIRLRILEHSAYDCLEAVLNGNADFGLNMINVTNANVEFTPLVNEPFVLACRRDHPLAQQSLVMWEDLADYPLIGVRRSSGNRVLIEQALQGLSWKPNWFYEVRHLSTSLGLVEAGLGIAALPSLAMPKDDHPILVSKPLVEPVVRRTLGLVQRRDPALTPAAERFKELLLQQWSNQQSSPWINKFNG